MSLLLLFVLFVWLISLSTAFGREMDSIREEAEHGKYSQSQPPRNETQGYRVRQGSQYRHAALHLSALVGPRQ